MRVERGRIPSRARETRTAFAHVHGSWAFATPCYAPPPGQPVPRAAALAMDEEVFIVLFALGVAALALLATLLGVIGYFRSRGNAREIAALREELGVLRASGRVERAPAAGVTPGVAPHVVSPNVPSALPSASPAPVSVGSAFDRPSAASASTPPLAAVSAAAAPISGAPISGAPISATPISATPSIATPSTALPPAPPTIPPIAPPRASPAPSTPPRKRVPIEKLLGVTGAAVLGGIILAVAGVYLYAWARDRGLITPAMRVAMGYALGAVCLAGSGPLRKRGYAVTGDALAGGGVVILYAASWAAHQVFGLWHVGVSYGAMITITVLCAWLALRRSSQLIAALGLLGGFATPLALSTGSDHPIGLFGYTLLVNLGFLSVAHKRRWPQIGVLALVGTFGIEALWILNRMRGETFWIALLALGVFAALFVVFTALQPAVERARWAASQLGALLLPFFFALYFATQPDVNVGRHLAPIATLAAVILACGGWVARRQGLGFATLGTAAGSIGVVFVWVARQDFDYDGDWSRAWELAVCCAVLALVQLVHVELAARAERRAGTSGGSLGVSSACVLGFGAGAALLLAILKNNSIGFTPWFGALAVIALVLARTSALSGRAWITWASAIPLGLALWIWSETASTNTFRFLHTEPGVWILASAALYFGVEWLRRMSPQRTSAAHAQAIVLACGLCALAGTLPPVAGSIWAAALEIGLLGLLFASAARRAPSTVWLGLAAVFTAYGQADLVNGYVLPQVTSLEHLGIVLAFLLACGGIAGFALRGWFDTNGVARVRALTVLLWLIPLREVCSSWTSGGWKGLPAALLAATVFGAWTWSSRGARATQTREVRGLVGRTLQKLFPKSSAFSAGVQDSAGLSSSAGGAETGSFDRPIDTARAWFHAVALSLALAILPLQFDKNWPVVALALAGAGIVWVGRRERRVTFACAGAALLALGTISAIASRVAGSLPVYEHAFANWLAWIFLVPAAAAVFASNHARQLASSCAQATALAVRIAANVCGIAAIVLVFAWLNLAIRDAFGTSPSFGWSHEHLPARDLTLSIAWALYALTLLVLGVSRRSSGLRWMSLILFLASIAKVFLFDLGHLEGLQRVASLLGLAIALLGVSVLYQRFVFRRGSDTESTDVPPDAGGATA